MGLQLLQPLPHNRQQLKLPQSNKMLQEPITSMHQAFVIQLKLWPWEDHSLFHSSNHSLLCSFKVKSLLLRQCWQLLHHKNKSKCWENVCSRSFQACILNLQEKLLACYWKSTIPNWFICWNTMNPSRARLTKLCSASSTSIQIKRVKKIVVSGSVYQHEETVTLNRIPA